MWSVFGWREVFFLDAQRAVSPRDKPAEKSDDRSDPEEYFRSILCKTFIFRKVRLPYLLTSLNYKSRLCSEQKLFCKLFSSKNSVSRSDSSPWKLEFPVLVSFCLLRLWAILHNFIARRIFTSFPCCFCQCLKRKQFREQCTLASFCLFHIWKDNVCTSPAQCWIGMWECIPSHVPEAIIASSEILQILQM